jgi:hypothetical protein
MVEAPGAKPPLISVIIPFYGADVGSLRRFSAGENGTGRSGYARVAFGAPTRPMQSYFTLQKRLSRPSQRKPGAWWGSRRFAPADLVRRV